MRRMVLALIVTGHLLANSGRAELQDSTGTRAREPTVGLPCEGCGAVFEGLPETLDWHSRIAPRDEPGEPLRIEGTVFGTEGRPAADVIVYAYHTNAHGIYPREEPLKGQAAHRHGRLRGWARSDERGRYRFDTIRPASYPSTDIPAHVHMHVIEIGRCTYYIDDILFNDDPLLSQRERTGSRGRGGTGIVMPKKAAGGGWAVTRDIILGERIPGYPAGSRESQ